MKEILAGWNLMRALRLVMGVYALIVGFIQMEVVLIIAGMLLAIMAIFNTGCCGSTCYTKPVKPQTDAHNDVIYEEIK